jgi:glycosyltransferase involved in cell wall biosynthesis
VTGRVIYAVKEPESPGGGIRIHAHHVELLRAAGVDAWLWFRTPGYRLPWFETTAPILSGDRIELSQYDVLVVPELYLLPGIDPAPGARKVIFNQNHFLTYWSWRDTSDYPGWTPMPEVWAVSHESRDVLARLHPDLPIHLVPNPIDTELFRPGVKARPTIAWMPRRRPLEAAVLDRLLRNDPRSDGVEFCVLSELTEPEVAEALGRTSVFIALGISEGFGLPVAEALAAGCLVVGYPAGGGTELFEAPGTWRVEDARPHLLADRALELVTTAGDDPVRAAARQWIKERYDRQATRTALLAAVESARQLPGRATTATHPVFWPDNPIGTGAERAQPWKSA